MTLTREEILAMEPGSNLDMLVAVHVFGYEPAFNSLPGYPRVKSENKLYSVPVEEYSINMLASWEVVKKIGRMKILGINEADEWYASVLEIERVGVFSKSAEESICKAALLAVLNL